MIIKKTKKFFHHLLNYLTGGTMCLAGYLVLLKGNEVAGTSLIVGGISKIMAHDMQSSEIENLKKDFKNLRPDDVEKSEKP